jgi:hypothetical protein
VTHDEKVTHYIAGMKRRGINESSRRTARARRRGGLLVEAQSVFGLFRRFVDRVRLGLRLARHHHQLDRL